METRAPLGRLSLMMFLQYAVWGAWMPLGGMFLKGLGFTTQDIGSILGPAAAVGAVLAPFIAGQFADRRFNTERFLSFLLLCGGIVQFVLAGQTGFTPWLVLSIVYSVLFMPTLGLSNSMAFANLTDRTRQFPKVRVWGTIGFIAALWAFPMAWLQHDLSFTATPPFLVGPERADVGARLIDSLRFSGILSIVYAVFCLFLPRTPPKKDAAETLAFAGAFRLFKRPSFAVLVVVSVLLCSIHMIYHFEGGNYFEAIGVQKSSVGPALSVGQFSEILMIASLGVLLSKLGFRTVLSLGALAYVARYGIWSQTQLPVSVLVASQALHGICYACFYAAAYIYVDRLAPADVRHSAQTVFSIITLGAGPLIGGWLLKECGSWFLLRDGKLDYHGMWMLLAGIGAAGFLVLALFFRDEAGPETKPAAS